MEGRPDLMPVMATTRALPESFRWVTLISETQENPKASAKAA